MLGSDIDAAAPLVCTLVRGAYREALASVTRNRNLRLSQLSSLSAWTGEFLFLAAMTVYAFDTNGA